MITLTAIVCGGEAPPESESLPDVCPKCGANTEHGYGLAGGGFGPYVFCTSDSCEFFAKQQERDEESP